MRFYNRRYDDPYNDYDWDNDGTPGEFVYGDDFYFGDDYCDELWKRVHDFDDYWVSTHGRVYSEINQIFLSGTPTGRCGHLDVCLWKGGHRYHRYIHRLVAEAFIPNPNRLPIVRHLNDDPSYNYVGNLAWGTIKDNIRDCINNGNFKYFDEDAHEMAMKKRRMPIIAVNIRTGKEMFFASQQEASRVLGLDQPTISAALLGKGKHAGGYHFRKAGEPLNIDLSSYKCVIRNERIKATNLATGAVEYFGSQTEASRTLGIHISSISTILSGRAYQSKGYTFERCYEEEYDD